MKVHFLGAAQTVTGSCYVIEACGIRFAVDCGMHQGGSAIEERNLDTERYEPTLLRFLLLTHAHIDHSGLLPRLVRDGFKGPIYCTAPTADLVTLMLEDSAHIQEMEAEWRRKKQSRGGQNSKGIEPLYTVEDARKVPDSLAMVPYREMFSPHPGIEVVYHDAGHILGAAFLEVMVTEDGKKTRLIFSGDVGRPGTLLMFDPENPPQADYLFVESTYGDRNHKNEDATLDEMAEAIAYSYAKRDRVIIPAFAVGRTQEILYCLYLLAKRGQLPSDMPIYVDSPLAIRATDIFKKYKDSLNLPEGFIENDMTRLLPNLRFTLSAAESQALNGLTGAAIIISASGMCNAGRVRHHLRHNLWRPGASIIFVGYQGVGTPGRKLVDGASALRLFNEDIAVKARIFTIGGFSAHAGQNQLMEWIGKAAHDGMRVVLIHGEEKAQETLAGLVRERFGLPVSIPGYMEVMELDVEAPAEVAPRVVPAPVEAVEGPRINWAVLVGDTEFKMAQLKNMLEAAQTRPYHQQVELRDRLLELNKELLSMLTHL